MVLSAREVPDAPDNASNDVSDEGSMPSAVKLRHKGGIVLAVTQVLFIWDQIVRFVMTSLVFLRSFCTFSPGENWQQEQKWAGQAGERAAVR